MVEETTTVTAPDWKQKADKLNELLKTNPEAGEQVVYRSRQGLNDDPVCVPELVSEKMEANSYPDVVTAPPADMISPKYSWYGDTGWFENATQQQGTQIAGLEANIKAVSQSLDDLKKDKQAESVTGQQYDEKMNKLIKLATMTSAQVGTLMKPPVEATTIQKQDEKIDQLIRLITLTRIQVEALTKTPTTASTKQPTVPVTQQPATPATQQPVVQKPATPATQQPVVQKPTAPVTQSTQPTAPVTAIEGGKN